jgi:hypothetical protein
MKTSILLVLVAASGLAGAALPPADLDARATITLPLEKIAALLDKPKAEVDAPPPVAAALSKEVISLSLNQSHPRLTVHVEGDVLAKGWTTVPLIGTPFTLASVSPATLILTPRDGTLCLLSHEPGHISADLVFDLPPKVAAPNTEGISLDIPPVAGGSLSIEDVPEHSRVNIRIGDVSISGGVVPLPATGGEIAATVVDDHPITPTNWKLRAENLVRECDDRLPYESHLHLSGSSGSGLSAKLELPVDAVHIKVDGPDLRASQSLIEPGGVRVVNLDWSTPGVLDRDLVIYYEMALPSPGMPWQIRPPKISNGDLASGRTVLLPQPGISIHSTAGKAIDDVSGLPAWMARQADSGQAYQVEGGQPFVATAVPLPRLVVETAQISQAHYATRIVSDGACLSEATISISHRGSIQWRFSLPASSELLACSVDGQTTNPIICSNGELMLALPGDLISHPATTSEVAFSYIVHGPAVAPVEGNVALALPGTPLFIESLVWDVQLPTSYELTAFNGNVEPAGRGDGITFRKQLVRNDVPAVEIYYRKHQTSN